MPSMTLPRFRRARAKAIPISSFEHFRDPITSLHFPSICDLMMVSQVSPLFTLSLPAWLSDNRLERCQLLQWELLCVLVQE